MTTLEDLRGRTRTRDNYEPAEFIEAYTNADAHGKAEVRELFRSIEDGRFAEMLDAAHNVLARSDLTRREHWKENAGTWITQWVVAFGYVEDLNTFPDLHQIPPQKPQ